MNKVIVFLITLLYCATGQAENLEVNFGLVLKNELGEPIGFKETTHIPAQSSSAPSLFGFVVTRTDDKPFLLGAIHILPGKDEGSQTKIMGKPMMIINRGAIFMQTSADDKAGNYKVEIYIDNSLYTTIDYQVVEDALPKPIQAL